MFARFQTIFALLDSAWCGLFDRWNDSQWMADEPAKGSLTGTLRQMQAQWGPGVCKRPMTAVGKVISEQGGQ
ncbi:hypothetical protein GCM10018966_041670 [Streptomyces yanii]